MPTYLCHGFRWQRRSIRVYVVVQNLDDAAPEWIIRRGTSRALLTSFYSLFDFMPRCAPPGSGRAAAAQNGGSSTRSRSRSQGGGDPRGRAAGKRNESETRQQHHHHHAGGRSSRQSSRSSAAARDLHDRYDDVKSQDWSAAKLLEEYDPLDLTEVSRPYAYVADHVVRIDTSLSIADEIARYEQALRAAANPAIAIGGAGPNAPPAAAAASSSSTSAKRQEGWLERLRDQLQRDEDIRWYVVVNGDEERQWATDDAPRGDHREDEVAALGVTATRTQSPQQQHHAQYTHQQLIFEGADRDKDRERERERRREQLRQELAGDRDILRDARDPQQPPRVPDKEVPAPPPKGSGERSGPGKPAKGGGLRRLFGRNKGSDGTKG